MRYAFCFLLFVISSPDVYTQTDQLGQFWNEYAFSKDLSQKCVLEFDIGLISSSVPDDSNIFHNITQIYLRGWGHYYPSDKWKFSIFYAYYSNQNVPELSQKKAPEFRTAIQVTYSLVHSPKIKVNLRGRIEDRHIENDDDYLEAVQRFRFQIKAVSPVTSIGTKKNVLYVFVSDELFFKTKSQVSGPDLFDRNRTSIGVGFVLRNNIQIETSYANEIMPRTGADKLVNAFQLKVIFNNFFPSLIKNFKRKRNGVDQGNGNLQ